MNRFVDAMMAVAITLVALATLLLAIAFFVLVMGYIR